jgi:hypothetical protein
LTDYLVNDDNVVFASSTPSISAEETCELFDTLLYSIVAVTTNSPSFFVLKPDYYTRDGQESRLSALFELLRFHFLEKLFSEYHQNVANANGLLFSACPPEFLRSLISTVARYGTNSSQSTSRALMNNLLMIEQATNKYTTSILKASLLESFRWPRTLKYGLHVVKMWLLLPDERIPELPEESTVDEIFCYTLTYLYLVLQCRTLVDEDEIGDRVAFHKAFT